MILLFKSPTCFPSEKTQFSLFCSLKQRPLLTWIQLNKRTEFLRYQLNGNCAPYGISWSHRKEKVLEHRHEVKPGIPPTNLLRTKPRYKESLLLLETDESVQLSLRKKPICKAHIGRPSHSTSYRYSKGVWYAQDFSSWLAQISLWTQTSTKLNEIMKNGVCYPGSMTDVHNARPPIINACIKSYNIAID